MKQCQGLVFFFIIYFFVDTLEVVDAATVTSLGKGTGLLGGPELLETFETFEGESLGGSGILEGEVLGGSGVLEAETFGGTGV